jgi:ABC-type lipoprotein release transport system permease subunit
MTGTIIVGLLSLVGTIIGTLGGIIAASKLTNYRIEQLEKKVEKHNGVIERVFKLETREDILEGKVEHLEGFHEH